MYEYEGIDKILFLMLYGGVAMLATMMGIYLLWRRGNAVDEQVEPPAELRHWAAAFMAAVVGSHLWWALLGNVWLTDEQAIRNVLCISLDLITLVPMMMAWLLRLLQDRRRPLWPWLVVHIPLVVIAIWGITTRNQAAMRTMVFYQGIVILVFLINYFINLRHYGRWLRDNYADLEHKELWQSMLVIAVIVIVYCLYTTNSGTLTREYLSQVLSIFIIAFTVWRVETMRELSSPALASDEAKEQDEPDIETLLQKGCEATALYTQHNLSLSELASAVGTTRQTLSQWFAQHDGNYNTYINHLRINHFTTLYSEALKSGRPTPIFQLGTQCGYRTFSAFAEAFRTQTGKELRTWLNEVKKN